MSLIVVDERCVSAFQIIAELIADPSQALAHSACDWQWFCDTIAEQYVVDTCLIDDQMSDAAHTFLNYRPHSQHGNDIRFIIVLTAEWV